MLLNSSRRKFARGMPRLGRAESPERWVARRILRHSLLTVLALAGSVGAIALYSVGVVQIGALVEAISGGRLGTADLRALLLVLFAILVGRGIIALVGSLAAQTLAQRLERDVREEVFGNLLRKSQTFHNRQRTGDLMARVTNDVDAVSGMIYPGSTMLLDSLINAAVPLVAIALLEPRLLVMPVAFLVIFALSIRRYSRALDEVSGTARWRFGAFNARVAETITAFETVQAFGQEERLEHDLLQDAAGYRDLVRRQGRLQALYPPTLIYGVCLALGVGHALVLSREGLPLGVVVAYLGLFGQLRYPMSISSYSFWLLSWGRGAVARIQALLEDDALETTGQHADTLRGHFVLEGVSLELDGNVALQDVSLELRPGETVALVGPTGSGKTLLGLLLNRTYDPTSGRLVIDGVDARDWDTQTLRAQLAHVEQDVFLFARSVADNIAFGRPGASRAEIEEAAQAAHADAFVQALPQGFDTVLGEGGVTLSGGQRQRLALARALLVDAPVLLLDDATSAIDALTEASLRESLRRSASGRTTLLITNRLSQVQWADRIVLMQGGRVHAQGSHAQLLATSVLYRQLFSVSSAPEVSA